jgi:uncharacterized protein YegL
MNNLVPSSNSGLMSPGEFQTALKEALAVPIKSRPYTARMTRDNPSAFVFLIDQSGSMEEEIEFQNESMQKSEAVALIVNQLLNGLIDDCMSGNEVFDYFEIAIIGYGQDDQTADFVWEGTLAGKTFVKPSELFDNYLEKEVIEEEVEGWDGPQIQPKDFKKWILPVASGLTPMHSALNLAAAALEKWLVEHQHKDIFPPVVINITDGDATDAKEPQLLTAARRIKDLHTSDGHLLVLNVHLSTTGGESVIFPSKQEVLPNAPFARLLFDMSSEMPALFNPEIAALTKKDSNGFYTGMAYNTDMHTLVRFLNIGTITKIKK